MLADIPGWKRGERGLGMPPAARHACSSVRSRQDLPARARSAHPEGLTVTGRQNACGVSGLRERPPAERESGGGFLPMGHAGGPVSPGVSLAVAHCGTLSGPRVCSGGEGFMLAPTS